MPPLSALAPVFHPAAQPTMQPKRSVTPEGARSSKPAKKAVLNTVELMEHVFRYLSPKQLITEVARVCKTFNTIIKTSPSVQQILWQRADPKSRHITWKWEGSVDIPCGNEDAIRKFIKVGAANDTKQPGECDIYCVNPLILKLQEAHAEGFPPEKGSDWCAARFLLATRSPSASALPGYLSDWISLADPCRVKLMMGYRVEDLADSATCRTMHLTDPPAREVIVVTISDEDVTGDPPQVQKRTITKEAGVLFGDVVDAIQEEYHAAVKAYGPFEESFRFGM